MGKTIRISDEDYERASSILEGTRESMADLFSRGLKLLDEKSGEMDSYQDEICHIKENQHKTWKLLYRLIRTVCPLEEADVNDPDFGITLTEIYEDKNRHPEKYRD